jgi:hypothetical protein
MESARPLAAYFEGIDSKFAFIAKHQGNLRESQHQCAETETPRRAFSGRC